MAKIASCVIVLGSVYAGSRLSCDSCLEDKVKGSTKYEEKDVNESKINWVESANWLITSYGDVNEALYSGEKIKIVDRFDKFLGLYREDFLSWVRINGSGIGDGIGNDKTKFLSYDYDINDGVTHYLVDSPIGAYNNTIFSWMTQNPSVAVNPPLPYGTRLRFKDLNLKGELDHPWIEDLLLSKTFYADDRFFLPEEEKSKKKIDVYVGIIESKGYNYQSLYLEDVTLLIESPKLDLDKDGLIGYLDFQILAANWQKEDKTSFSPADLNYDQKVDLLDFAIFAKKWKN